MEKIVISWEAIKEDFITRVFNNKIERAKLVNTSGPTYSLHKDFEFTYNRHIILSMATSNEEKEYPEILLKELQNDFKDRKFELRYIQVKDPLDMEELFNITNKLLLEFNHQEVEVFVSTGYPNTRVAWFILQPNFRQNLRLFQIRQSQFSQRNKPEKVYYDVSNFNPNALSVFTECQYSLADNIYIPQSLKKIYDKAKMIALTENYCCLILGENGTGKENLARFIHQESSRRNSKFIAVNCAAYSDDLLRSELFGYEKGAFTGADKLKKGVFEEADGGTILLDEIGDITSKMQVSLLRVLQEKKIQRVGGIADIDINVRVIAATNKDLELLCEQDNFRWDLFFRLAVTVLNLPPLRDWSTSDKRTLVDRLNSYFLKSFKNKTEKLSFSKETMRVIMEYPFKGNIRELQNLIISLYIFTEREIVPDDIPSRMKALKNNMSLDENEKNYIQHIVKKNNYNISASARILNIARDTLYNKIEKYNIKLKEETNQVKP